MPNLKYPFKREWYTNDHVSTIGWAYRGDEFLDQQQLAEHFATVTHAVDFKESLLALNGHFAVVLESPHFNGAAVDHIRSIPLLYKEEPSLEIFCDPSGMDLQLSDNSQEAFIFSWCTPGSSTLDKNVKQLLAGQYVWQYTGSTELALKFYYRHFCTKKSEVEIEQLEVNCSEILEGVFKRLVQQIGDRHVLIPLSAGYDSRLVLSGLVKAGLNKITTYTYGRPDSHEVEIARAITQKLNIEWHYINYEVSTFQRFFSEEWEAYSNKNHFYSSLPHEQDFFALSELKARSVLPDNFVAIPGFCGDLLGGSITAFVPAEWTEEDLSLLIRKKHLGNWELEDCLTLVHPINSRTTFYDNYQQYFVENKVSKFIVNSVRVYEYFGGDYILPLWDRELSDFFYSLPYKLRERQSFYNDFIFKEYFKSLGIDIRKPSFDDNYANELKRKLKSLLPKALVKRIRSLKKDGLVSDPIALQQLNQMIFEQLNDHEVEDAAEIPLEINETHARYFLQNLRSKA